ncbi:MAG: flagellar hook-associated protein FlgK [Nitrosomonas sp.]|nr:MAG: flagellar hook-associated protein FlgK [Nitrosomonas sp.]
MGNSILTIGVSGLLTAQNQLLTTSHNISNADTPGFSRQKVILDTNIPHASGSGFIGQGVQAKTVERIYNQFLVSQSLQVQAESQYLDSHYTAIQQLDDMFAEATSGLSPALQNFFSAIQDVATNPSVIPSRQSLLSNAEALVARFHSMDQHLNRIREGVNSQITSTVAQINSLAEQITEVNKQIVWAEGAAGGRQSANDMLDQRDALVTQLNKLINTDTIVQSDGSMNVYVGNGQPLVVGVQTLKLQASESIENPENLTVNLINGSSIIRLPEKQISGGTLGGILSFRSATLDSAQNAIGRIAMVMAQTFNEQHQLGMDLNGDMGGEFFNLPAPKIISALTNNPASTISAEISDYGALTTSGYEFSFNGTDYTLTRLSDNTPITSSLPITLDGVTITGAAMLAGERFRIQPTVNGAKEIEVKIKDTAQIAAAAPNRTNAESTNVGTGTISVGTVDPLPLDPNLQQPLTITFHTPYNGMYDVTGTGTGLPATSQVFAAGADISFNGFTFQISGEPAAGDVFTVKPNNSGVGDNRNILALGALQTTNTISGGSASYQAAYGQLVSLIGNKTRELEVTSKAQANLFVQTEKAVQAISGVNLDEEAANLLRFQQTYQAASKIIEMSNTLFDSVLRFS